MRFQLRMIAKHFEDGLRALASGTASDEARALAERAYTVGSRQLGRVPWERAWAAQLKELFELQTRLRSALDDAGTAPVVVEESPLSGVR
jgi:hypothetical protein